MANTNVCIMYDKLKTSINNLTEIEKSLQEKIKILEEFVGIRESTTNSLKQVSPLHDNVFTKQIAELESNINSLYKQMENLLGLQAGLFNAICRFQDVENEGFTIYTSEQNFQEAMENSGKKVSEIEIDFNELTKADEVTLPYNNVLETMKILTGAEVILFTSYYDARAKMEYLERYGTEPFVSYMDAANSSKDSDDTGSSTIQYKQDSSGRVKNYGSSSSGYTDKNNSSPESNTENNTTTEEPTENKNDPETKEPAENKEEQTTTDNQTAQNDEATQSPQQNNSNPQQTAPQNSSTSQSNGNNQVVSSDNSGDTLESNPTEELETEIEDNAGDIEGEDYTIPSAPTFTDIVEEQLIPKNTEIVSNSSVVAPAAIGLGVAGLAGVTTKKAIDKKKKPRENRFIIPQNNFFPDETTLSEDNNSGSVDSSNEFYEFIKDQIK